MTIGRDETNRIKGIAIVFVLVPHVISNYFQEEIPGGIYLRTLMGITACFLFLFVSGYGMFQSFEKKGLKEFWDKKIRSVFFPYWIITILYVFMFIPTLGPQKLWTNLLCIDYLRQVDGTMWYMSFYLLWMIAFFVAFKLNIPTWFRIVLLFLVGWWFMMCGLDQFQDCAWQFKRNPFSFPVGILAGWISVRILKGWQIRRWWMKAILLIGACTAFVFLYREEVDTADRYLLLGILFVIILHSFFNLVCFRRLDFFLEKIGESSFMLYLIEGKLFTVVARILPESPSWLRFILFVSFCILIVVLVSVFKLRKKTITQANT